MRVKRNFSRVALPSDPPPGALKGKVYYTYDTIYNQIPKPYPLRALNSWTHDELIEKLEKKVPGVGKPLEKLPAVSPSERDFPIRVKELKDLLDSSTSGDENDKEPTNQEKNSSTPSPLDSPPDSGIHGSECHDDERQQPVAPVTVAKPTAVASQVNETSSNYLGGDNTQVPSTSSGSSVANPPKRKLACTLCEKKFNNVSSLNFHTKKFHPGGDSEKDVSPEKVILTIQRDGTGNFSSKPGSKNKPPETHPEEEDNSNKQQVRTRKRSVSSNDDKVSSTSSQTKQSEPPQTRLRRSRENSQPGHKKPKKSSYYNDSEYNPTSSSHTKWKKFVDSDREESENESVSDVSESTPPVAKKKNDRGLGRKKTRQSDIPDSPIAKNTRMRAARASRSSPSPSRSENESSTSELEISDKEKSDSGDSDDAEELTEKSTTSESSLSPPPLTDYGTDSDDLFTPVITKRKKQKVPKEKQDCGTRVQLATKPARKSARAASEVSSITSSVISPKKSRPASEVSSITSKITSTKKEHSKKCTRCSMEYKDPSSFIQHLYKAHEGIEMYFSCGFCQERFSTAQDISIFNTHIIEERNALMKKKKKKDDQK